MKGRPARSASVQEVVRHGMGLGLNVFGNNRVARALHESARCDLTTQEMQKVLTEAPDRG